MPILLMPDRASALARLRAESFTERLAAARELKELQADLGREGDRAVREALANETVPWVRGALTSILDQEGDGLLREGVTVSAPTWDERLLEFEPELARAAISLATARVLHEVAAVVGRAKLAAADALDDQYPTSETARELEFLADYCGALRTLSSATKPPNPTEFDLSEAIRQLAESVGRDLLFPVHADGPGPFMVVADRTLLLLALQNVLINAVEATQDASFPGPLRPVVVAWGPSANGVTVSVIDRGPGPPSFLSGLKTAGVSTKDGHPGYGLATASEALKSMNGAVTIRRNDRGGATVALAWRDHD
jgi:signal transduction histidine kinase